MRKNNEGYVLPFVLVVMIVLTIIATSLMTAALRNLQSQQKFTERMVDKYQAEGEIEKIVAQLSALSTLTPTAGKPSDEAAIFTQFENHIKDITKPDADGIEAIVKIERITNEPQSIDSESDDVQFEYKIEINIESLRTEVTSEMLFSGKIEVVEETKGIDITGNTPEVVYTIKIFDTKVNYNTYEISTKEVPGE